MTGAPHLFIPGPTNVPERVRRAMNLAMEDMRAPDFPAFTRPLFEDLKRVFRTEAGRVFLFPSSGTGAWEAALSNTLSPGDKVIAASFGQFSTLWVKMCRDLGLDVEDLDTEWGESFPIERLAARLAEDDGKAIKAVLVCHNETATGVTSDVAAVRRVLDAHDHPALLYVDGVSSIASIDFRMDDWGVDLAVTGSQKGLMLPTGLGVLAVSPKALEASKTAECKRCYFDLGWMAQVNDQGYFPYTPATTLLRGLRESLDMLFEEGLDQAIARHHRIAEGVRRGVAAWGLELCAKRPEIVSDTVTAVMVPDGVSSDDVVRTAYHRYNSSFGVGLAKVAGKVFRIGHLGLVDEVRALSGLAAAEMALLDCGAEIPAGAAVAAAGTYYRETAQPFLVADAEPKRAAG